MLRVFTGGTPVPLLFQQANESGVAAFDSTIGSGSDDDVVAESAISSGAFLRDFDSVSQKRQRELALLVVSPVMNVATLPSMVASPTASPVFG